MVNNTFNLKKYIGIIIFIFILILFIWLLIYTKDNKLIDSIKQFVKEDTKVLIKSTSLFGGVENKKKTETNDKSKTIYINAFCMFGGVDIK